LQSLFRDCIYGCGQYGVVSGGDIRSSWPDRKIRRQSGIRSWGGWECGNQRQVHFDTRMREPEEEKATSIDAALAASSGLAYEFT
jgi:hypothetical protein